MRIFALLSVLIIVAGCADQTIKGPPVALGDFSLGHNVVVTKNTQSSPVSRNVSNDELKAAMTGAIDLTDGILCFHERTAVTVADQNHLP